MFPTDAIYCFRDISRYKTLSPGHVVESQAPSLDTQVDEYKYYALEVVLLPLK